MGSRNGRGSAGWLQKVERRLFPNDSPYQRARRRNWIFFGVFLTFVLVWGAKSFITRFSSMYGRQVEKIVRPLR